MIFVDLFSRSAMMGLRGSSFMLFVTADSDGHPAAKIRNNTYSAL